MVGYLFRTADRNWMVKRLLGCVIDVRAVQSTWVGVERDDIGTGVIDEFGPIAHASADFDQRREVSDFRDGLFIRDSPRILLRQRQPSIDVDSEPAENEVAEILELIEVWVVHAKVYMTIFVVQGTTCFPANWFVSH